jgi:hypothetical protein
VVWLCKVCQEMQLGVLIRGRRLSGNNKRLFAGTRRRELCFLAQTTCYCYCCRSGVRANKQVM